MSKPPFEQIVAGYGPAVWRVCRTALTAQDAEDAWSETFIAALRAYPELRDDANVEAWLVTIAHHKAMDVARSNARRPVAVGDPPERPSRVGRPEDWDADLWDALRALPERQRGCVAYQLPRGAAVPRDHRPARRHDEGGPARRRRWSVATAAGSPSAVRAVGTACATNPLPVIVPCHRVVRSDGSPGGYVGGDEAKHTLLTLEAAI